MTSIQNLNKLFILFTFLFVLNKSLAQSLPSCKDLHSSVLYQYPKNSGRQYIISQNEGFEKDVDVISGDSSIYENKWLSDCVLSQKCQTSTEKIIRDNWKFVKKHNFISEIIGITDSCFLINVYLDKLSDKPLETDTMWFNQKLNVSNNPVFKKVTKKELAIKSDSKDTSKYAIVNIYRPFKIPLSLASYTVYGDSTPMFVMKNNSGYIYKVYSEGIHTFQSKLYNNIASTVLEVKFGKTYYIKSSINWGITSKLYNFRLDMQQIENVLGASEFEKVKER